MSESYAQRKAAVQRQLRQFKRALNLANAVLEVVRRETDRLLRRKTLISPESMVLLGNKWGEALVAANSISRLLAVVLQVARSFL